MPTSDDQQLMDAIQQNGDLPGAAASAPPVPVPAPNPAPSAADNAQLMQAVTADRVDAAGSTLVGTNGGRLGCASTVCHVLNAAGIPFPNTPNAREMESQMSAHGFKPVPLNQAQVIFGAGTGPSRRHAMIHLGDGRTLEDPGGIRGTNVQYGRVPVNDRTATGWAYSGSLSSPSPPLPAAHSQSDDAQLLAAIHQNGDLNAAPSGQGVVAPPASAAAPAPDPVLGTTSPAPATAARPKPVPIAKPAANSFLPGQQKTAATTQSIADGDLSVLGVTNPQKAQTALDALRAAGTHYLHLTQQGRLTAADNAQHTAAFQKGLEALQDTGYLSTPNGKQLLQTAIKDGLYKPAPSLLDNAISDVKSDVTGAAQSLLSMAMGSLGAVTDTNEEEDKDQSLAQGRAAVGALASGTVLHPLGLQPGEVTSNAIDAAEKDKLGQFIAGVPAGIEQNAKDHPVNFGMDALTALGLAHAPLSALAERGLARLPDPLAGSDLNPISAGEHITQAEGPASTKPTPASAAAASAPAAEAAPTPTPDHGFSMETLTPEEHTTVQDNLAKVANDPQVGSLVREMQAELAARVPQAVRDAAPPVPQGEEAGSTASPSGMAGSVNLDRLNISPEAKGKIADAASSLPETPVTSRVDLGAKAKSMALTVDDLRTVEPGKYPISTDDLPALGRSVRQLNAQHGQAAAAADAAYQASPTPANLAAAVAQNENLRIVTAHNDRIGTALGAGLSERAETVDPFAAKQRAVQQALRPFQGGGAVNTARPTTSGFGQSNTLFTSSDFQGAMQGLKQLQGQVNSGLPPVVFKHLLTIGGYVFEGGVRAFPSWAKAVRTHAVSAGLTAPLGDGDLRPVYRQMKAEAQRRAQAALSPKEQVREQLLRLATPQQVPAITEDLARVGTDKHGNVNTAQLAEVLGRHSAQGMGAFLKGGLQAGLLSNPITAAKIALAHGLYLTAEELKRAPASLASKGAVQGASLPAVGKSIQAAIRQGLPGAGTILLHGQTALDLSGRNPTRDLSRPYRPELTAKIDTLPRRFGITNPAVQRASEIANTAVSLPLRAAGRMHGALLHVIGTGTMERARIASAEAIARQEARAAKVAPGAPFRQYVSGRVGDLMMNPTEEHLRQTMEQHNELMLQNENKAHTLAKDIEKSGPLGKAAVAVFSPFSHIPSNVAGKALEMSGGGLLAAPARLLAARLRGEQLTPEQSALVANTFGRGVVGMGLLAAGYGLGKQGIITPPDEKHGEYGSANIAGRKVEIGGLAPFTSPLMVGAKAQELQASGQPPSLTDARDTAMIPLADQPLAQGVKNGANILGGDVGKAVGNIGGEFVPSGIAWYAAQTDPAHAARQVSAPLDAIKKRLPGLRETLPIRHDLYGNPVPEADASFMGLRSRPLGPADTPAMQALRQVLSDRAPQGQMTPAQQATSALRQSLTTQAAQGHDIRPALQQAIVQGQLTLPQARTILRNAKLPPVVQKLNLLPLSDALDVYEKGKALERFQWQEAMQRKLAGAARSHTLTPQVLSRARRLGLVQAQ